MTGTAPRFMLSFDPGLVTGLAVLSLDPVSGQLRKVLTQEGDMEETGTAVEEFLTSNVPSHAEIVGERFTITVQTAKNSQAPWSLEVIGMVKWLIWKHWVVDPEATLVLQQPSDAKGLVPNALLHSLDLWHRGGEGHANDALRHGIYRYAMTHRVRYMFT